MGALIMNIMAIIAIAKEALALYNELKADGTLDQMKAVFKPHIDEMLRVLREKFPKVVKLPRVQKICEKCKGIKL